MFLMHYYYTKWLIIDNNTLLLKATTTNIDKYIYNNAWFNYSRDITDMWFVANADENVILLKYWVYSSAS